MLQEIVDSGNTLNSTGDYSISFEVENFKQSVRERLVTSTSFVQAIENVARFASDEMLLKSVKDDLSRRSYQSLNSYLTTLRERLAFCHKYLDQVQQEYSNVYELTQKHSKRIAQTLNHAQSQVAQCAVVNCIHTIAGSGVAGIAGFVVTRILISTLKPWRFTTHSSVVEQINEHQTPEGHLTVYEYIVCLLIGITFGVSYLFIAKRFGFCQRQRHTQPRSLLDTGFAILQSAERSIKKFLSSELHNMKDGLLEMEQYVYKSLKYIEGLPDNEDVEDINAQLDKLQQEMKGVLSFVVSIV